MSEAAARAVGAPIVPDVPSGEGDDVRAPLRVYYPAVYRQRENPGSHRRRTFCLRRPPRSGGAPAEAERYRPAYYQKGRETGTLA